MAGITVDIEDMKSAENQLQEYIRQVQLNVNMLRGSAQEFQENVGSDMYSQRAIQQIESSIRAINKTLVKAEELVKTIKAKRNEIENSISGF